jgi:intracellular multiplication protein IcmJ
LALDYLKITLGIARIPGSPLTVSSQGYPVSLAPDIRQKILERDHHTCRFCGFISQKYQEVHALNGNLADTSQTNLVTACIFCHQCFDLEKTSQMKSGVLIWLPEITQADLHHIARAVYVARISQGSMAETAKTTYETLMSRREEAKVRLGTDDPFILATVMKDFLTPRHYALRDKKLEGLRLFPLDRRIIKEGDLEFNQFPQILAYWRSKDGPFGGKIPHQWKTLYAQMIRDQDAA